MWETQCHTQLPVGKKWLQAIYCDFGDDFLGKKNGKTCQSTGDHFPQGFFQGGSCTATPEKQKKISRKVFIPCPIWCYCDNTWLEKLLALEKTKTTLIILWRRPEGQTMGNPHG